MAHPHPTTNAKKPKAPKPSKLSTRDYLNATLYSPTEVLSGESLRKSVDAQVEGTVKPQVNAINQAIRTVTRTGGEQARRSSDYYKNLVLEEQRGLDLQKSLQERSAGRLNMYTTAGENRLADVGKEADARANADASVRGAGLEGGGREQLAKALESQQASQGLATQVLKSESDLQGDNYRGLLQAMAGTAGLRGGESQSAISGATAAKVGELVGKRTDIAASRGGLRQELLNKMRGDEFNKIATLQGLGIKRETIAQQAASDAARVNATIRGQDTTANTAALKRDADATQKELDRASRSGDAAAAQAAARRLEKLKARLKAQQDRGKGKPPKPATRSTQSSINKVAAAYRANAGKPLQPLAQYLRGKGYTDAEVAAGADLATRGYVLPSTRTQFRKDLGLLPRSWRTKPASPLKGWPFS